MKKQLTTDRGLLTYIIFSAITFGIYPLVAFTIISNEVNIVAKEDGKSTMPFWAAALLGVITFGIVPMVWFNNICNRIGEAMRKRNLDEPIDASTYWLWGFLGSFLCGIGAFVFIYKFLNATNKLNAAYNQE